MHTKTIRLTSVRGLLDVSDADCLEQIQKPHNYDGSSRLTLLDRTGANALGSSRRRFLEVDPLEVEL